ncbi:MAG: DNA alkylation repair protein, partial [Elusimicrobiota bacterium]|nr:DNA alkylation repair protein [Elusimicrobiota bacterium]
MKNTLTLKNLHKNLFALANPSKAKVLKRFFKTGPGEYIAGEKFLGIVVPEQRKIAEEYKVLKLSDLEKLIKSRYHEERMVALLILVAKIAAADEQEQKKIYDFYLNHTRYINNWDLVDLTAEKIIGQYLENKDKKVLEKLARSKVLWERRIAMLATFHYIKQGKTDWPFK